MSAPSRGAAGRSAFLQSFPDGEARRQHMREIGARGNAERVVLSGEERRALCDAYALLHRIALRHGFNPEIVADAGNGGLQE